MTKEEILRAFPIVEKEDLVIWPDSVIEGLRMENVMKIMQYLSDAPLTGEELLVYDLPAFLYPFDRFKALWENLSARQGRGMANRIREEELTPSDEFERMEKKRAARPQRRV